MKKIILLVLITKFYACFSQKENNSNFIFWSNKGNKVDSTLFLVNIKENLSDSFQFSFVPNNLEIKFIEERAKRYNPLIDSEFFNYATSFAEGAISNKIKLNLYEPGVILEEWHFKNEYDAKNLYAILNLKFENILEMKDGSYFYRWYVHKNAVFIIHQYNMEEPEPSKLFKDVTEIFSKKFDTK
jgi:hypothetical protein